MKNNCKFLQKLQKLEIKIQIIDLLSTLTAFFPHFLENKLRIQVEEVNQIINQSMSIFEEASLLGINSEISDMLERQQIEKRTDRFQPQNRQSQNQMQETLWQKNKDIQFQRRVLGKKLKIIQNLKKQIENLRKNSSEAQTEKIKLLETIHELKNQQQLMNRTIKSLEDRKMVGELFEKPVEIQKQIVLQRKNQQIFHQKQIITSFNAILKSKQEIIDELQKKVIKLEEKNTQKEIMLEQEREQSQKIIEMHQIKEKELQAMVKILEDENQEMCKLLIKQIEQ